MNYLRTIAIMLIIICMPLSLSWAQSSANHKQILGNQVIETLALSHSVLYLAEDFKSFLKQNPFPMSEDMNQKAITAYQNAFDRDLMMNDFRQIFAKKISDLSGEALRSWLQKSNTQKLTQERQKYYTLQGKRKRIVALYELEQNPPTSERQQLLATYANVRTPEELLLDSRIVVLVSVIKKIDQLNSQINITASQLNMIANNTRKNPNDIQQHRERILKVMFYGVPSKAIQESLHFWQSQTGQSLTKVIFKSLKQTYRKAAQRLSQSANKSDK